MSSFGNIIRNLDADGVDPLILLFDITCFPFNVIGDVGAGVNLGSATPAPFPFLPVLNPGNPYSP